MPLVYFDKFYLGEKNGKKIFFKPIDKIGGMW